MSSTKRIVGDDAARFESKVDRSGDCHLWIAQLRADGYGEIRIKASDGTKRNHLAHVYAWEQENGPVPDGLVLHHRCETRACVNTAHLQPMTRGDHARHHHPEPWGNAVLNKTHCKNGHELTEENIYRPPGRPAIRMCRACRSQRKREQNAREKAARRKVGLYSSRVTQPKGPTGKFISR